MNDKLFQPMHVISIPGIDAISVKQYKNIGFIKKHSIYFFGFKPFCRRIQVHLKKTIEETI